ncbi:MAG TPA: twin-arginine translocase TatA/TatE family subunit [Mariprofundaceae bacterium]|nr:twin-arginine translocase TatA/TatE family subunit [Mariprofundaceae bacterium]
MPDIGLFELILIGAVAFLVLGPERLPEFFAQIGRAVRRARGWAAEIRQQINVETEPLRSPATEVRAEVQDIIDAGLSTAAAEASVAEKPAAEKPARRKPAARKPAASKAKSKDSGESKPAPRKRAPRKKAEPKPDSGKDA